MQTTTFEFRFRYLIHALIFALGFWAPWDRFLRLDGILGSNESTWLALASLPARNGWLSFSASTIAVLIFGILLAVTAAGLRTWGSAYLGASVVKDDAMHGNVLVADGPYRYMRNPLYLGTFLHAVALALLMPPTGALFSVILIGIFQMRLIAGEERFLRGTAGPAYAAYCVAVPRVWPAFTPRVVASGTRARWAQAMVGELYMIGVALSFCVLGWRYNAFLLTKCVLVALGVSLVARAFLPPANSPVQTQEPAVSPSG